MNFGEKIKEPQISPETPLEGIDRKTKLENAQRAVVEAFKEAWQKK
jgi:hypothetical protein